jgi:orotidine-5'-phosphate decarboxylase
MMIENNPRVIVALDFSDPRAALALAARLEPASCVLKVGKELFVAGGLEPVREMIARGFRIFLDLKFHDIPNTVGGACAAATRLGVWMMNVHAAGGAAMLAAARHAVDESAAERGSTAPLLIAVTVLTSLDDDDLKATGIADDATRQALRLARLTADCGLDGVVCSAQEAPVLRAALGPRFKLVTPGIRPAGSAAGDQSRIVTPQAAIANGADYLVIGRPITEAPDPVAALSTINASLPPTPL